MSSPAKRAARWSAMSMPAATPAAVSIPPWSTQRRLTGTAPYSRSVSRNAQCVVAFRPVSRPAAPRISELGRTDAGAATARPYSARR
ncbi:hypothetical protein FB470_004271 [Amycolatopsis thermophila]|uniref:Uncharacterized protein n=1 Tax=Amycolatopsis thermophila TaxID=206084 RepID=A0ABU0EYA2_9PSEU|nr:hypothetical protein [Amycolatopsis thermophila]